MTSQFEMFSVSHSLAIVVLIVCIVLLFTFKHKLRVEPKKMQRIERAFALSLITMEILYHYWLISTGRWELGSSLPVELCSISLFVSIVLLWNGNRQLIDFIFFAGIAGAMQAILTPVLDRDFPHFRYFQFFYMHIGIIVTALYFYWVKGYRPTFNGIVRSMIALNILLPFIFLINVLVKGNYMFLREKPYNGSLLDFLGPYPWYLLSLEVVAFIMFVFLWLLFKKRHLK